MWKKLTTTPWRTEDARSDSRRETVPCAALYMHEPPAGDRCQAVWTTDDSAACEVDQYGCPSVACDGSDKPWCMMEDGQNWCYCE